MKQEQQHEWLGLDAAVELTLLRARQGALGSTRVAQVPTPSHHVLPVGDQPTGAYPTPALQLAAAVSLGLTMPLLLMPRMLRGLRLAMITTDRFCGSRAMHLRQG